MIPWASGGFSQSGSADATNAGTIGGAYYGGINTGTTGIDVTTLAIIAAVAVVALMVLRR
jgi:hypothetical protein